jgi:hypothetical protein
LGQLQDSHLETRVNMYKFPLMLFLISKPLDQM